MIDNSVLTNSSNLTKHIFRTSPLVEIEDNNRIYPYSSVYCPLPSETSNRIIHWGQNHIPEKYLYFANDRDYGIEKDSHITVLYGIHTLFPEKVIELVQGYKPFYVELGKINRFTEPEKFDVLKVDIKSSNLHELNYLFRHFCSYTASFPSYKPHITIAYIQKESPSFGEGDSLFYGSQILIQELIFTSRIGKKFRIKLL